MQQLISLWNGFLPNVKNSFLTLSTSSNLDDLEMPKSFFLLQRSIEDRFNTRLKEHASGVDPGFPGRGFK